MFDSTYCYDYSTYVSLTLQALISFVNLELPHLNVKYLTSNCLQKQETKMKDPR